MAHASSNVWTSNGPYTVNANLRSHFVGALAIDPSTPSTLYAGTVANTFAGNDASVFKSTNSGGSWSAINTGLSGNTVAALAIDPTIPSTLYAATYGYGVFKSTNSGGSWSPVNNGLSGDAVAVLSLAIDPSTPSTLYAGTVAGMYKSTDSGGSWSAINTGLSSNTEVNALAIDPTIPSTLYAATYGYGVFKSTNSGGSWSPVNTGLPPLNVNALAIDPSTPSMLYAGTAGAGMYKSTDNGGSWSAAGLSGAVVYALAIDPATPSTLYAGIPGGVYQSTNSGGSWSAINAGLSGNAVSALAIDPSTPSTLYGGTNAGVYKSTNSGGSWSAINAGPPLNVNVLAIDPNTSPSTLYAATCQLEEIDESLLCGEDGDGVGVYKSTDGGASWGPANPDLTGHKVSALAIAPTMPSILYAAMGDVFISTNSGGNWSWTGATPGCDSEGNCNDFEATALAIDPSSWSTVYAGGYLGIYRSTDSGHTWVEADGGLTAPVITLATDPTTPGTLYAGTNIGGVFKSTNSGGSWSAINSGLPFPLGANALAIDKSMPSTLYAATYGDGVVKSTNSGTSWIAVNTGLNALYYSALAIDPTVPSTLYVGAGVAGIPEAYDGVYQSTNSGSSWIAINTGLVDPSGNVLGVSALAIDRTALYAGTTGGVYEYNAPVPTPTPCIGNCAPPSPTPTPTSILTQTQTPSTPELSLGTASGAPGDQVSVSMVLYTGGEQIAFCQNDISFDRINVAIAVTTGNQPDCTANAAIDENGTGFGFLPQGCSGTACTGVRGQVFSTINNSPIPDGSVLYTCTVTISDSASLGTYPLSVTGTLAGDPNGTRVSIGGYDGAIVVRNETPAATAAATQTPTQTLTPTQAPTVTPTPISTPRLCVGDCNGDGEVTVNELMTLVNIALGTTEPSACVDGVPSGDNVNIALILTAVNNALNGCTGG